MDPFKNAGKKLRYFVLVLFGLSAFIACVVVYICLYIYLHNDGKDRELPLLGIGIGIVIVLVGYLSCFFLYSYAELCENVAKIAQRVECTQTSLQVSSDAPKPQQSTPDQLRVLRALLDEGKITQAEYDASEEYARKNELLK